MIPSAILISGLINIETTLSVDGFPIDYTPVRYPFFGVNSTVSGVGYNIAKALTTLGNEARFVSLIGSDIAGSLVCEALAQDKIPSEFILAQLRQTAQSAILYDPSGKRMINTDLKDVQQQVYPPSAFAHALKGCALAVLCNINFSRPYLRIVKERGILIATDVHTIADLDDEYNREFMAAADILFMSDEGLPCAPREWIQRVQNRYGNKIIVIGLGGEGALLAVKDENVIEHIPAVSTRPVVNTIGAGDSLFSSFLHSYLRSGDPHEAIRRAVVFASYKIGEKGAAEGFLDSVGLDELYGKISGDGD